MRANVGLLVSLLLVSGTASAQSLVMQASAGPTVTDAGYSLAAAIGFSPHSRLSVLAYAPLRAGVAWRF